MLSSKALSSLVKDVVPSVISFRRELHRFPELSQYETKTALRIQSKLTELEIPCESHVAGHGITGVIAGRNPHKAVAIRADMDALPLTEQTPIVFRSKNPGVMHACGHDIHMAILCGTAQVLSTIKEHLPYSVKLLFQPAEETIGGAKQMIDAGCLSRPKVIAMLGLHVDPFLPAGKIRLTRGIAQSASCEFTVTLRGCSCHGAAPHTGRDPLLPCCTMITALPSFVYQRVDLSEPCLLSVGQMNGGWKNNIIPGEAEFGGIIRTLSLDRRSQMKTLMSDFCNSLANAYGISCVIAFTDTYPPLKNHDGLYAAAKTVFAEMLGTENLKETLTPAFTTDDFSWFCQEVPGLYYHLGAGRLDGLPDYPLHSPHFYPDEKCIETGILTETAVVLALMEDKKKRDLRT